MGEVFGIIVGPIGSAYIHTSTKLLYDWKAIQTISAMILCEYLSQNSGPLWKAIRGGGYGYGVYLSVLPDSSIVQLEIDCSNLTSAYKITNETVVGF
ncbi:unnamed protein product [Meloidogyne enterolobii]|uniref:Uncharacterized protein n=1 Tax=Meloidogyne enterolobii TaxID=390850 RepID=A0ACB1AW30_MELEN